jgi:hypothetical protein
MPDAEDLLSTFLAMKTLKSPRDNQSILQPDDLTSFPNSLLLLGEEAETLNNVVAGAKLKKIHAYEMLAEYVNQHCGTNWDREDAMNRWRALFKKYKAVKRAYTSDCGTK